MEVGHLDGLRRIQRPSRIPVVLTVEEVRATLNLMHGVPRLMAELLYGAGLRVAECVTLRVKDIDFRAGAITVRSGKGAKDRATLLPARLVRPLQQQTACWSGVTGQSSSRKQYVAVHSIVDIDFNRYRDVRHSMAHRPANKSRSSPSCMIAPALLKPPFLHSAP
ncbi:MAG: tyrosine-type recombinase/integrase [Rhodanobacteraceae bacterium]